MKQLLDKTNFSRKSSFFMLVLFCLLSKLFFSQESYDNCANALEICPNVDFEVTNIDASKTFCANCDDNFNFCFTANNTIWIKFTSNELGGFGQVNFSNLIFESALNQDNEIQASLLEAGAPCDATTYTAIGNCISNGTTNFSLSAIFAPSTQYYLVISGAKNGPGITKAAEATMTINLNGIGVERPFPFVFLSAPDSLCKYELATFSATIGNCPDSANFQWFINGELVANTSTLLYQSSSINNNDVLTFTCTCFEQCKSILSTSSLPIFVEKFEVNAGLDQSILPGESISLIGSTDASSFFWTPTTALSNELILNPIVSPETTTSYFLVGEKNDCVISDEVIINVSLKLDIPNTFTPNEDGYNDTWKIPSLENYPNCLVQIFDRWGQLVFSSTGYNEKKSWDGKINGKKANESVYFYTIELRDDSNETLKGSVTIIR
jgi:gliding motility-associated-like protein